MTNSSELIEQYVAVWNESDANRRRKRIRALWTPDGVTCYRLLDARGYEAIEARVTTSWDKWLRTGEYIFKPRKIASHHNVVRFDWLMMTAPEGAVEATGLSFLLINTGGCIRSDYQFNPSVDEANDLVERYVAIWNENDAIERRQKIAALWTADGAFFSETYERRGHEAIEAEAAAVNARSMANGFVFTSAKRSHAHHNVASFQWQQRTGSGEAVAAGSELLILDDTGRILCDYQFKEPLTPEAGCADDRG